MAVFRNKTKGTGWVAKINYRDHTGKWRQAARNVTGRRQAEDAERQLKNDREKLNLPDQRPPGPAVPTTGAYLKEWLASLRDVRSSTAKRYKECLAHAIREIGDVRLDRLKPQIIESVYTSIDERGLSRRTALNVHRVFKKALSEAVDRFEYLERSPMGGVKSPRPTKFDHYRLSLAELDKILAAGDATSVGPLLRVAAWTGLRLGEVLGLKWSDLDLEGARLTVRRSITTSGHIGEPKTRKARRTIVIFPWTVDVLRGVLQQQILDKLNAPPGAYGSLYADEGWMFADKLGHHLTQWNVHYHWRRIVTGEGVNLPDVRLHDLRHWAAAHLLGRGWPLAVVAERLGHEQMSTTADVYAYAIPNQEAELAKLTDRILGG